MENDEKLTSRLNPEDFVDTWQDEFGVEFSKDRKRLLRSNDPNLKTYVVPEGTVVICDKAFSHVVEEDFEFETYEGYSVTGSNEYSRCGSFIDVEIPSSVEIIGHRAFYYCKNLAVVKMAPGVKEIGGSAFGNCYHLQQIDLPDTIEELGWQAFKDCPKDVISIPERLKDKSDYAFGIYKKR